MKRINAELTDEELVSLIAENPIGRNKEISDFIQLLDKIEDGYSFFLNASWGDGKTVFVRQTAMVLEELNTFLDARAGMSEAIAGSDDLRNIKPDNSYLPIYYNAWRNDTLGDPLPSLVAAITTEFDLQHYEKDSPGKMQIATAVIDTVLKPFNFDVVSSLAQSLSGKDYLDAFRERKGLQENVDALIDAVLPERAQKLVLFIDELDRCSPMFSLRLLEEVKFLFENDRVIIVFSTDLMQLAFAISGAYGANYDGERYLERFYDRIVPLQKPSSGVVITRLGIVNDTNFFNQIVREVQNRLGMTFRASICYVEALEKTRQLLDTSSNNWGESYFLAGIMPILHAIRQCSINEFKAVTENVDPSPVIKYLEISKTFSKFTDKAIRNIIPGQRDEITAEERETLISDFCILAFMQDRRNEKVTDSGTRVHDDFYDLPALAKSVL